jgi:NitT/TauT family transport system substrate-binding protein
MRLPLRSTFVKRGEESSEGTKLSSARLFDRKRLWLLLAIVSLAPAGCGTRPASSQTAPNTKSATRATGSEPEAVALALNWFPEAEHGGYVAALVHGYYKEAGLEVRILPGGPSAAVLQRVAARRVEFGIENADRVLLGREQQADCVALLAPLQKSPRAIMVHAASKFRRIEDLAAVTLAVNSGSAWVQYLKKKALLRNVRFVPYSGNVAPFLVDKSYAQQAYVFSEPFVAEEKGAAVRCLLVAESGYNPYTSLLVTSGEMIRSRPEMVRKFVAASLRGWQTYLERPEETNRYIHEINPEMGLEILAFGAKALGPLCTDGLADASALGQMAIQRWSALAGQLVEADVMAAGRVNPSSAFTNEFLPQKGPHGTAR